MSRGGILLMRGAVADMAVQYNESGAALRVTESRKSVFDALDVVGVADAQNVPPVPQKPRRNIFRERDGGISLDGDVVVVIDPAEVVESQVGCQRRGFRRDAFHHATVSADRIDLVVENLET